MKCFSSHRYAIHVGSFLSFCTVSPLSCRESSDSGLTRTHPFLWEMTHCIGPLHMFWVYPSWASCLCLCHFPYQSCPGIQIFCMCFINSFQVRAPASHFASHVTFCWFTLLLLFYFILSAKWHTWIEQTLYLCYFVAWDSLVPRLMLGM